jgi:protein CWC15
MQLIVSSIACFRSDESDDEDDDEAELQAELARIKAEREQAQARKIQEDMEMEQRVKRDNAMKNNPLAMIEENSAKVTATVSLAACKVSWVFILCVRVRSTLYSWPTTEIVTLPTLLPVQIKRRWNDDVVFRNQARDEPEQKKRFINDTIRSDFHRNFIKKFMK